MWSTNPPAAHFEIQDDYQPLPCDKPCYSPTRNKMRFNWTKSDVGEDESVEVEGQSGWQSDTIGLRSEWIDPGFANYSGRWINFTLKVCDDINPPV